MDLSDPFHKNNGSSPAAANTNKHQQLLHRRRLRARPWQRRRPPANQVRSTGSYWGAAGEQIDLVSGNLNFSLAPIQAKTRGAGATFALSYNSQIWRRTGTSSSKLAVDVGYGLG